MYDIGTGQPIPGLDLTQTWCPGNARADTDTSNIQKGYLFAYNRSAAIYHCPADHSQVERPPNIVLPIQRTRSYNMNQSVNGLGGPDKGTWWIPSYQKYTEIRKPSPGQLFIFIDVHEQDILDALFGIPPTGSSWDGMWFDLPANRHGQGSCLSFADGHAEHWRWKAPKIFRELGQTVLPEEYLDYRRLQAGVRVDWN